MKKWILVTTIILWISSIPLIILGVDKYIEDKDNRLRKDFNIAIQNIFNDDEYIDVCYCGRNVNLKRIELPAKPSKKDFPKYPELYESALSRWEDKYGDLTTFYRIDNRRYSGSSEADDGWKLIRIYWSWDSSVEQSNMIITMQCIFPYAVGYKKDNRDIWYSVAPSLQNAVDDAFKFYTSDPNSGLNYEKGSYKNVLRKIHELGNEYYYICRDTVAKGETIIGETFSNKLNMDRDKKFIKCPIQYGYMHNGYYKVFIGITQPMITWSAKRSDSAVNEDRIRLLIYWLTPTCIFFGIIIILLTIMLLQKNRRMNETDYHKLLRLSHPRNFMKPYDKDKVEKANCIYKEVEQVKKDDVEKINSLIQRCIDDLDISFIDSTSLEELRHQVNPEHFMNPYDAEKVQEANKLYAILAKPNLTYSEYIDVKNKAKQLKK